MRTPPGVSPSDYAKALTEFQNIVGKEWVFTSDEDLDLYRDAFSPLMNEPEEKYFNYLQDIFHEFSFVSFIVTEHTNRYSPGWNNDKLLVMIKK